MLTKLYYFLHRLVSRPEERNDPSKGYWQNKARQEALNLSARTTGRLLEIGCGEGLFLMQLAKQNPRLELWGIDHSEEMLNRAKEKFLKDNLGNIHVGNQKAENITLQDGFFDTVACINVFINMGSLENVKSILAQMKRLCKPSGKIIFDFRNALNPLLVLKYKLAKYYDETVKNYPLSTFYPKQIEKILKDLNFTITEKRFIGFRIKKFAPIITVEAQKNAD